MKTILPSLCLLFLGVPALRAQRPSPSAIPEKWVVTEDFLGTPRYMRLELNEHAGRLTGRLNKDSLEGTLQGENLHFIAHSERNDRFDVTGVLHNGLITATMVATEAAHPETKYTFPLTAKPIQPLQHKTPVRHEFKPTVFYRDYSAMHAPVLTIAPGDTIHTTTVDAGGTDEHNVRRSAGGNPQTGPFYVEGAMPGDVLVVHINKLRLNRDWALSDDAIVDRGQNREMAIRMKDTGREVRWHLDLANGTASPERPDRGLSNFHIPLRPMLGCIATAVSVSGAAPGTGDSGYFGGNMDFNEVGEGSTVYLRVANPGALLYFGDGHARQGDGELNGNALETSMDVDLTVDVIPNKQIGDPRVETSEALITMGLDGSLDDAFKEATSDMTAWLAEDYKLTPSEIAQFIGVAAEYRVSEVADRNAGVVLKIRKSDLQSLQPPMK